MLPFGGSTSSPSITFEFIGLKDGEETDEVDGFECKLDEADWQDCVSPKSYPVSTGAHKFQVRSYITLEEPELQGSSSIKIPQTDNGCDHPETTNRLCY